MFTPVIFFSFFFQAELVSWLAEEMSQQGLDVDQLDIASNSPLHLAAKHGCTTSAAALLHYGTQVTLKVFTILLNFPAKNFKFPVTKNVKCRF